jgi:hypothetical protein
MLIQLQMGYSAGGASHIVLLTHKQAWGIGNKDYMKSPQEGAQKWMAQ